MRVGELKKILERFDDNKRIKIYLDVLDKFNGRIEVSKLLNVENNWDKNSSRLTLHIMESASELFKMSERVLDKIVISSYFP